MKKTLHTTASKVLTPVALFAASVHGASAQLSATTGLDTVKDTSGLPETSTVDLALNIIQAVLSVLGLIALGLIIYGGFVMLTSAGSPDKVKTGRDILVWAFIGITIILGSLALLTFIDGVVFGGTASPGS